MGRSKVQSRARQTGRSQAKATAGTATVPTTEPEPAPAGDGEPSGLSSLTVEQLRAELAARGEVLPADEGGAAPDAPREGVPGLLEPRDHKRGCIAERVEAHGATVPAQPSKGLPARDVTVCRCMDCGGQTVILEPYDVVIRRVAIEKIEEAH